MIGDPVTPATEYKVAARVVVAHYTRRCFECTDGGCWLADWARRVLCERWLGASRRPARA